MADPTPLPQTFHVDAPEIAPTPAPGNSPVPDDVHSQLADALGVPAEAVTVGPEPGEAPALAPSLSEEIDDAPSSGKSVAEILAERATYRDPSTYTKPEPTPSPTRPPVGPEPDWSKPIPAPASIAPDPRNPPTEAEMVDMGLTFAKRPVKDGWWENGAGKTDAPYSEELDNLFNKVKGSESFNPPPGFYSEPSRIPFRDRAELSQNIKRVMRAEKNALPDVEVEGLHIIAQLVAKLLKGANGDQRAVWSELARHCDDVAAALRG